ncbi:hypothetical protein J3E68DRAFT_334485 [Trichoderma sp. SZMC 28012]
MATVERRVLSLGRTSPVCLFLSVFFIYALGSAHIGARRVLLFSSFSFFFSLNLARSFFDGMGLVRGYSCEPKLARQF